MLHAHQVGLKKKLSLRGEETLTHGRRYPCECGPGPSFRALVWRQAWEFFLTPA
jgi:hypothetical protein